MADSGADRRRRGRGRTSRNRWLLSAPALLIILLAATGPLLIVLVYSFLTPGPYGDVKWEFSPDGWTSVFFERDIFDDTLSLADAHLSIFWRSVKLSLATTIVTLIFGFPTAYFIATRQRARPRHLAVPDHHSVLDQPADPHLRGAGDHPQRRHRQHAS